MSAIVWSERPEHNAWEGRRSGVLVAHVQVVADAVAFRWWTRSRKWSGWRLATNVAEAKRDVEELAS